MRLGVEHPLVEREGGVVVKEEVEVLEGLGEEEGLHVVVPQLVERVAAGDIVQARVAAAWDAAHALEGEKYVPAPVAVLLVVGQPPHHKQALHHLRPQQIVLGAGIHYKVAPSLHTHYLRGETSGCVVEAVARLGELLGEAQVVAALGDVLGSERHRPRQEAHQMVHLGLWDSGLELLHIQVSRGRGPHEQLGDDSLDVLHVEFQIEVVCFAAHEPGLEEVLVEGVNAGAEGDHGVPQLWVGQADKAREESVVRGHRRKQIGYGVDLGGVLGVARENGEVAPLELQGADLRNARSARVYRMRASGADLYRIKRQSVRALKRNNQNICKFFGFVEVHIVMGEGVC
mmetsp:Transcript_9603/g.16575  ORF Transcript_9603/g.16575 Transcript_9603/m.16575 type:complete len:344 (-) Transcript_9603:474-1505(-)